MILLTAVLIGVFSAFNGVALLIGAKGKVYPIQLGTFLSGCGMLIFGLLGYREWAHCSWEALLLGALGGVTQYASLRLFRKASQIGPFSPIWCSMSLCFVPILLYAGLVMGESLTAGQIGSVLATIGAILCASAGKNNGKRTTSFRGKLLFGFLLISILICGSILPLGMKFGSVYVPAGLNGTLTQSNGKLLLFFTYLFMGLSSALDLSLSHTWRFNRYALYGGLLISVMAIFSYALLLTIITAPAAIVFPINYSTAILVAALISSLFFGERRTPGWYGTLFFSISAILLAHWA